MVAFFISFNAFSADGDRPNVVFNHDATNFPLRGLHTNTACENCHMNGVFKGTPTSCSQCHSRGGNSIAQMKPAKHIPITRDCDQCHKPNAWLPANFSHSLLTQSCVACHNNTLEAGKPSYHIQTSKDCGECHKTSAWLPAAGYDHTNVINDTSLTCSGAGCHNGSSATGAPSSHVDVMRNGVNCRACHTNIGMSWLPANVNASIHTAIGASNCKICHSTAGNSFTPAKLGHVNITAKTNCNDSGCHTTSTWLGIITYDHALNNVNGSTSCAVSGCHDGNTATGMPQTGSLKHLGAMLNDKCGACHAIGTSFNPGHMDHNLSDTTACTSCHSYSGNGFTPKPSFTHVVTKLECSRCHVKTTWYAANVDHSGFNASTNCTLCHNGIQAVGVPAANSTLPHTKAPMTSTQCGSCHAIGGTFVMASWNHNGIGSAQCRDCHDYTGALNAFTPVYSSHVVTTADCVTCHSQNFVSWVGGNVHKSTTATTNCAISGCHGGTPGPNAQTITTAATANVPHTVSPLTNAQCGSCHAIGTTFALGSWNHAGILATSCSSCHNYNTGAALTPTFAHTNIVTSGKDCSDCHSKSNFLSWANGDFHKNVTSATNCAVSGCHGGTPGTNAQTIANASTANYPHTVSPLTNTQCGSCHGIGTTFVLANWNHAGVGACSSCHSYTTGKYQTPIVPNHITIGTTDCGSCHSGYILWTGGSYAHQGVTSITNCAASGCHGGTPGTNAQTIANASTANYPHTLSPLTNTQCGSCHAIGTSFVLANWNHAGVTGTCSSCHSFTLGKYGTPIVSNHISIGSNDCNACHISGGYITWAGGIYSHPANDLAAHKCSDCHNGSAATGATSATHSAMLSTYSTLGCDSCHRVNAWSPAVFTHSGISNNCNNCHKNGPATKVSLTTHMNISGVTNSGSCEACHSVSGWTPTKPYSHSSLLYSNHSGNPACTLCHIGSPPSQPIVGAPHKGSAAYKGAVSTFTGAAQGTKSCAWCHSQQFKAGSHKKTQSPTTVLYTVGELVDCSGACHEYTNNTFATVKTNRTGHHHSTDGGW